MELSCCGSPLPSLNAPPSQYDFGPPIMSREFQNTGVLDWYATSLSIPAILPLFTSYAAWPENEKLYRWWSIDHEPWLRMTIPRSVAAMMSSRLCSLSPGSSDVFGIRWNWTLSHESANEHPCDRLTPVILEIND